MKNTLLIDALHIKAGGALGLLNYMMPKIIEAGLDFTLLKDIDCPVLKCEYMISNLIIMPSDTKSRNKYFREHKSDFSKVLCFGNIPPCVRMDAMVYTYMHNVSLLYIPADYELKRKVKTWLKRAYIRFYAKYTDTWIVQTRNTSNLLKQYINCKNKEVYLMPFFDLPSSLKDVKYLGDREDYCFIGEHTRAKGDNYLVEAWALLAEKGFKKKLHLTLAAPEMVDPIKQAIARGANIENHGHVTFGEVIEIYSKCKAIVYPSLNESLGLGIVEALTAGCDVIASDLPYVHSICKPSAVFMPKSPEAIVEAVMEYEKGPHISSALLILDCINDLVELLKK